MSKDKQGSKVDVKPNAVLAEDWTENIPQQPIFGVSFLKDLAEQGRERLHEHLRANSEAQELLDDVILLSTLIADINAQDGVSSTLTNQMLLESVIFISHLV